MTFGTRSLRISGALTPNRSASFRKLYSFSTNLSSFDDDNGRALVSFLVPDVEADDGCSLMVRWLDEDVGCALVVRSPRLLDENNENNGMIGLVK